MKKVTLASKIVLNLGVIATGLSLLVCELSKNDVLKSYLGNFFGDNGYTETINTGKAPVRYKTWYKSVQDVLNGSGEVAKAAESEGAVLLKNDNNALPLNVSKDKVSLFGVTAYNPMYSLDGAGEVKINKERQQYFDQEFKNAGLSINEDLASWYKDPANQSYHRKDYINIYDNLTNTNGVNANINGAPWSALPDSKSDSNYNTGIFITGRMTNEGIDLPRSGAESLGAKDGDYLKLTDNEISVLEGMKKLKDEGKLKKIVVLINQANPVMENLREVFDKYSVDAAMWIGYPGSDGIKAVAEILTGKVSPSGGLSTTWFTSKEKVPSDTYYARDINVLLQEGIYVRYKYAETRYEDTLLSNPNNEFNYLDTISYPFGYGLSYSTFNYKITDIELDTDPSKNYLDNGTKVEDSKLRKPGDDYVVSVDVTNTGKYAAKETIELYVNKPYLETDKTHGVEKASAELVGYGKTKKLKPGEKETLKIKVDANKTFASYDGTLNNYVLSAGDYYLTAATNSHEAVNNIALAKKNNDIAINNSLIDSTFGAGNASKAKIIKVNENRSKTYEYWTKGNEKVTNLFDDSDPNKASGDTNAVKYASRSNWKDTYDDARNQVVTLKGKMNEAATLNKGKNFTVENAKKNYPEIVEYFGDEYPKYGVTKDKVIQLSEMIGVEYEDSRGATEESKAKWETFLDQLTREETCKLVGSGLRKTEAIERIGKPQTNDVNASNAISWKFDMSIDGGQGLKSVGFADKFDSGDRNHNPTGYPCEGIIAATFNNDLSYAVGQAIGEDGLWSGASGLYGFGLGLHRNPYHGRAGEYYSEDPYLTGVIGGYESLGAQSKGLYVYNKHFILNDQETSRTSYNTWLTEQTMRETYIRPFELAIEIGDAMNVMNSFNNIGSGWSGNNFNLMTKCLRGELGMRGFAATDFYPSGGMNLTYGALAGTDLPNGNAVNQISSFGPQNGQYGFLAQAYRQSARRILYTVANSNAMNFIGSDTKIIVHEPGWINAFRITFITSACITVAALIVIIIDRSLKIFKK